MSVLGQITALSIGLPPRSWGIVAVGLAAPTLFWTMWRMVERIARQRARDSAHALPKELPDSSLVPPRIGKERRRVPRRAGAVTPIHLGTAGAEVELAFVLDRSPAGLRVSVRRALIAGTPFRLRATNAPADSPWVDATVRWCAATDGQYHIGCEFAGTPPPHVLLTFG